MARLDEYALASVNALVERTLDKAAIEQDIRARFVPKRQPDRTTFRGLGPSGETTPTYPGTTAMQTARKSG